MTQSARLTRPLGRKPVKKAANLSIDAELLAAARRLDINLSATLESALVAELRQYKRREWQAEHAAGVSDYNERVGKYNVFSDGLRKF
jgi:antitoxin CcdA